jgi:hypothetical protein
MRPDPNCGRYSSVETMEHLLCGCEFYLELLWKKLGAVLMQYLNTGAEDIVSREELGWINIVFNTPHPSLLLCIHNKPTRNTILLLTQEIKRDIIYRRMNLPPSVQQVRAPHCPVVPLDSTSRRLRSYLHYVGLVKLVKAIEKLPHLQKINLAWLYLISDIHVSYSLHVMTKYSYPLPKL